MNKVYTNLECDGEHIECIGVVIKSGNDVVCNVYKNSVNFTHNCTFEKFSNILIVTLPEMCKY